MKKLTQKERLQRIKLLDEQIEYQTNQINSKRRLVHDLKKELRELIRRK